MHIQRHERQWKTNVSRRPALCRRAGSQAYRAVRLLLVAVLALALIMPPYMGVTMAAAVDHRSSQATVAESTDLVDDEAASNIKESNADNGDGLNREDADDSDSDFNSSGVGETQENENAALEDKSENNASVEGEGESSASSTDENIADSATELEEKNANDSTGSADRSTESILKSQSMEDAKSGVINLNSLWKSQEGGVTRQLLIKEGGTYALSANLKVESKLVINAPGQDVTIQLGSYVLDGTRNVAAASNNGIALVEATSCKTLTIVGSRPFAGVVDQNHKGPLEQIILSKGTMRHVIDSSADSLVIRNVGISIKAHKEFTNLTNLDACGVSVARGSAKLENCSVMIDHGLQAYSEYNTRVLKSFPKGVQAEGGANSLELSNCSLNIIGSPNAQRRPESDYSATTCDNVYGVYAPGSTKVTVRGGSISVSAPQGSSAAVLSKNLNIEKHAVSAGVLAEYADEGARASVSSASTLALSAEGRERAFGLVTTEKSGININAPMRFSSGSQSFPSYQAALVTSVEEGIVFGSAFAGTGVSVIAGDLGDANADGFRFGTFANGVSAKQRQQIALMLVNGLSDGCCAVECDGSKLLFALRKEGAAAMLVRSDGTEVPFSSVSSALKAQGNGESVRLCKDLGSLVVDEASTKQEGASGRTLCLDFNGHLATSISIATKEPVRITSTGSVRGRVLGASLDTYSCLSYSGSGGLTVENIDLTAYLPNLPCTGVKVTGSGNVRFDNVKINVIGQNDTVRGINQDGGNASIDLRDSSVAVRVETPSVSAFGIESASAGVQMRLVNTTVRVNTMDGSAGAVSCKGKLFVEGGSSKCLLSAATQKSASLVYAVNLTAAEAAAELKDVRLEASCAEEPAEETYWCLMSGASSPVQSCSWVLDGNCSFESATNTHINYLSKPVVLGPNFASDGKIVVLGMQLENRVAFTAKEASDAASLSSQKSLFEAVAHSSYAGWDLVERDGKLIWEFASNVVENTTAKKQYPDIAEAVAQAAPNDVLELLSDCKSTGPLLFKVPVTLDLKDHELVVEMPFTSLAGSEVAAVSFESEGRSSILHGTFAVSMQTTAALCGSKTNLSGIQAKAKHALQFDDVSLRVSISGNTAGSGVVQLRGISAADADVMLMRGTHVQVTADTSQAIACDGIYMAGSEKPRLDIDASSSVAVQNDAQRQALGSIASSANSGSYQFANLMRFYPQEGSQLYDEIQRKFKESAKADVPGDPAGRLYDASLYYAAPLELDDGTFVWAFSDKVKPADVGKEEVIKPILFFSQSYYDSMPDAHAVTFAKGAPQANIAGNLSAVSARGSAVGISCDFEQDDKQGNAETIEVASGARIEVQGSTEAYRSRGNEIDLRKLLNIESKNSEGRKERLAYPDNLCRYREVSWATPDALAIGGTSRDCVRMRGIANANGALGNAELADALARPTTPAKVTPDIVHLTFSNLHAADGTLLSSQTREQAYLSTIAQGGGVPSTSNYELDGISYRFVGWSLGANARETRAWQPSRVGELVLDESAVGSGGNATLQAVYVPVIPGMHLATFLVDEFISAYGVLDGTSPDYAYSSRGLISSVPNQSHVSWLTASGFRGWKDMNSQVMYAATLPPAHGDCTYLATFDQNHSKLQEYCYAWMSVLGSYVYTYDIKRISYGENGAEELAKLAKPGDIVYDEAEVHSFIGWSARRSDRFALYGTTPPVVTTDGSSVYAIYETRDRIVPVSFYVDGRLYAQAERANAFLTVNGAFGLTAAKKPADKSADKKFIGWSLKPNDTTPITGAVTTLAKLAKAEEPLRFYAVYGTPSAAQDDDGTGGDNPEANAKDPSPSDPSSGSNGSRGSGTKSTPKASAPRISAGLLSGLSLSAPVANELEPVDAAMGADSANASAPESEDQSSAAMSLLTLVLMVAFLVFFAAWWILSARRNRKLDEEDDFFEPNTSDSQGERFVF